MADAIRSIGVTEVTYYRWCQEFGGLKSDQLKRLKELEAENTRLRRAVLDLTLDELRSAACHGPMYWAALCGTIACTSTFPKLADPLSAGPKGNQMPEDEAAAVAPVLILVVEDEALIREMVQSALADAGFGVLTASSGDEAIGLLGGDQGGPIRAVVTDVNLGSGASGWDVARRARELRPEMPMLYVTGGNSNEWAANGVPQSLLINKPFAPAQIVTAVSQVVNAAPVLPAPKTN